MRSGPRLTLLAILALALLALLVGREDVPPPMTADARPAPSDRLEKREKVSEPDPARFLTRVTFGATPGDIARLKSAGVEAWVAAALDPVADPALDARLALFPTLALTPGELKDQYPFLPVNGDGSQRAAKAATEGADGGPPNRPGARAGGPRAATAGDTVPSPDAPASAMSTDSRARHERNRIPLKERVAARILRAVYSENQFAELMTGFWMDHFNVSPNKSPSMSWLYGSYEDDAIRAHQFGRFRDLLGAVARSPAMLAYLDNDRNMAAGTQAAAQGPRMPEATLGLNENFARELLELHTLGVDGGYDQTDVTEVARILTGWGVEMGVGGRGTPGTFFFRARMHDEGAKRALGVDFPAGGGMAEGERLLDLLAQDPATILRLSTKLVRYVTGQTQGPIAEHIAERWTATDGDLKEVYRALLLHPALLEGQPARSPLMWFAAAARGGGVTDLRGTETGLVLKDLGQDLLGTLAPTGYDDIDWLSTDAMLRRARFAPWVAGKVAPALDSTGVSGPAGVLGRLLPARATEPAISARVPSGDTATITAAILTLPEFQYR